MAEGESGDEERARLAWERIWTQEINGTLATQEQVSHYITKIDPHRVEFRVVGGKCKSCGRSWDSIRKHPAPCDMYWMMNKDSVDELVGFGMLPPVKPKGVWGLIRRVLDRIKKLGNTIRENLKDKNQGVPVMVTEWSREDDD